MSATATKNNTKKKTLFTATTEQEIPAGDLHRYPANRTPSKEAIAAMAQSIQENGQLQPITARPIDLGDGKTKLEIIFGETRVLGCQAISPKHPVRAYIIPMDDQEAAGIHAIENFQRKELDPIEEAQAMENMRANGWEVNAIAETLGITRKTVSHRLRLLKLDDETRAALREGTITLHTAETIATLPSEDQPRARELCVSPSHSSEPLSQREALRQIDSKIVEPRKKKEEWEKRRPELEKAHKGSTFLNYEEANAASKWDSEFEDVATFPDWKLQSEAVRNDSLENQKWGDLAKKWEAETFIGRPYDLVNDGEPRILVKIQPLIDAELAACEKNPMRCIFQHPAQKKAADLAREKERAKELAESACLEKEFKEALLIVSRPESIQPAAAERLTIEFFKEFERYFDFSEGLLPGMENFSNLTYDQKEETVLKIGVAYLKTKSIRGFEAIGRLFVLSQLDLDASNRFNARTLSKILIGTKALKEKDFPLLTETWKEVCAGQLAESEAALKAQAEEEGK
jgi:ParB family chromosome partitioning protein